LAQRYAFIFDLDGTLVDSLLDIHGALIATMRELNLPLVTSQQTRAWVGDGLAALCTRAAPDLDAAAQQNFIETARRHYREQIIEHTRPYPNIMPMLDLLQSRNISCAVLSNKPHELTCKVIDALDMRKYFVEVFGNRREQDRKPAPVDALELAGILDVPPARILLVGDSSADILAARNAGMISVAVTWGFRTRQELAQYTPDFWIDDPLEALKIPEKYFYNHP
jgi:phosphoglycolate phosphatase